MNLYSLYGLHRKKLQKLLYLILASLFTPITAAHAASIDVLLSGNNLKLTYENGASVEISFNSNGTYKTNTGSSGTWTLNGETLCTTRNGDGASGCGNLPSNKNAGDQWVSEDSNGNPVVASIVPQQN